MPPLDCSPALLRAGLIAAAVALLSPACGALLRRAGGLPGRLAWGAVLTVLLSPMVMMGYAYRTWFLMLLERPVWQEAAYSFLLAARLTPVGALAATAAPTGLSPEAEASYRLARRRLSRRQRLGFRLRSPAPAWLWSFLLVFLLAFTEFEMASLCNVRSWTVRLFDEQIQGLPLAESFRLAAWALAVVAGGLGLLLACLWRAGRLGAGAGAEAPRRAGCWQRLAGWGWLGVMLAAVTLLPLVRIGGKAWRGAARAAGDFGLGRELLVSVVFSAAAAALAWWLAGGVLRRRGRGRGGLILAAGAPGLLGPLLVSLCLVALFQQPWLRLLYDTPVPLVAGLVILCAPWALALRLVARAWRPREALHAARLLGRAGARRARQRAAAIRWRLAGRGRLALFAVVAALAYFDVISGTLLAPIEMPTVWQRLYNFMHYGQSALLSARVVAVLAVPLLAVLGVLAGRAAAQRWGWHG
jgi:ABC-type Fe3+ transport system permease subunit